MKYKVPFSLTGRVIVKAFSKEEALEKTERLISKGRVEAKHITHVRAYGDIKETKDG